MKTDRYFASTLVAAVMGLTAGCVISAGAQTETPLSSTVVRLKGYARYKTDDRAPWRMIKVGELINPGSVVETAQRSDMDLLLGEEVQPTRGSAYNPATYPGNVVRLADDSVLRIDKLSRTPAEGSKEPGEKIMLELRSGRILGRVGKLAEESNYEIAFAGGVAGMRDTVYGLTAKGELSVLKGAACIALADGSPARAVAAEQQFDPGTGSITKLNRAASPAIDDLQARSEPGGKRTAVVPPPALPRPRPPASISPP